MKKYFIIILLMCLNLMLNAQDTLQTKPIDTNLLQDPYLNMKSFNTIDMALSYLNVNSNNLQFGEYTLKKGKYYPSSSIGMYVHIPDVFRMKNPYGKGKAIANIKTGFLMEFASTDLIDNQNKEFSLSQVSMSIPLIFSYRMPLNHGNEKGNKYFKAVSVNFGLFIGMPIANRLFEKGDITPEYGEDKFGDYLRWGYIAEFVYSALDKNGYGHRFGLRIITDANSVIKFGSEKTGIYPTYMSTGIFYTLVTNH